MDRQRQPRVTLMKLPLRQSKGQVLAGIWSCPVLEDT
jgi:hypothetical protein